MLSDSPECARTYDPYDEFADECRFHGSVGALPLSETCRDGCTWWTYRFDEDRLDAVLLQRTVVMSTARSSGPSTMKRSGSPPRSTETSAPRACRSHWPPGPM
ncbi:hypothetical protein OV203_21290 [Nannocystis sp. ILAH1]|uniref:hypothetical protein n=1 Tax=Nannocystis sp. ILAH1 TaxID=2996789 RepID=UPI00226EE298|nr:hypothetical protein [Nannocystis sp. ILAH1]MCY0989687.1 hypothetical protein [Nannocystis sp. ILAH1]